MDQISNMLNMQCDLRRNSSIMVSYHGCSNSVAHWLTTPRSIFSVNSDKAWRPQASKGAGALALP